MYGLLRDTAAELRSQKMAWVFGLIIIGALLGVMASSHIKVSTGDNVDLNAPMEQVFSTIIYRLVAGTLNLLVFLMVMSTAGIVPSMFEKGRADFYLSKPISRTQLLWSKVLAVGAVYGAILTLAAALLFLTGKAVHGVFDLNWLATVPVILIVFLVWYSLSLCAGLAFGSGTSAIVVTFLVWLMQLILQGRDGIKSFFDSAVVSFLVDALYWILPKPVEIDGMMTAWTAGQGDFPWVAIGTSVAFMIVAYIAATEILKRRDF